jgi:hypothetical protein
LLGTLPSRGDVNPWSTRAMQLQLRAGDAGPKHAIAVHTAAIADLVLAPPASGYSATMSR